MAANAIAPSGFQTLRRFDGAAPNYSMREEVILSTYGTRINFGDPVFRASDGTIRLYVAGGTTIHGIFRGCRYLDPGTLKTEFYPAWRIPANVTGTVFAVIEQDPFMTFMAQNIGTALTQASIGSNCDVATGANGPGTTTSLPGLSTCGLAAPITGSLTNTATLPFRIEGIIGLSGGLVTPAVNAAYVATNDNQWLEVRLNTPDFTTRTGQA
jgi:hypothetical protein